MNSIRNASIGILVAAALVLSWAYRMRSSIDATRPENIARKEQAIPSASAVSSSTTHREDYFLGIILAKTTAEIAPRFEGRLREVHVRLGDRVAAGTPIATLDAPALQFELRVAEANMEAVGVDRERTAVELAETEERLERRRTLSEDALVTNEDLATAGYQQKLAQARLKATHAQFAERRVRVEKLRRDNADTVIRAPFDGIIAARYADPGANVSPMKSIVRLVGTDGFFVRFAVPEIRANRLHPNEKVQVRIQDRQIQMTATINKIAPEVDAASRMVFVEAQLSAEEPQSSLLSGMLTRVFLHDMPQ